MPFIYTVLIWITQNECPSESFGQTVADALTLLKSVVKLLPIAKQQNIHFEILTPLNILPDIVDMWVCFDERSLCVSESSTSRISDVLHLSQKNTDIRRRSWIFKNSCVKHKCLSINLTSVTESWKNKMNAKVIRMSIAKRCIWIQILTSFQKYFYFTFCPYNFHSCPL